MTETTKPVLTKAEKFAARREVLEKRIAADTAALSALVLEIDTASKLAGVTAGTTLTVRLGRAGSEAKAAVYEEDGITIKTPAKEATAGTLRVVAATVTGVKELEDGSSRYKVEFGEGFDKDVEIIQASQIVEVTGGVGATTDAELAPSAVDTLYQTSGVNY